MILVVSVKVGVKKESLSHTYGIYRVSISQTYRRVNHIAASSSSSLPLKNCAFMVLMLLCILFRCPINLIPISLKSLSCSLVTLSMLLTFAARNASKYFSMLMNLSHSSTDLNSGRESSLGLKGIKYLISIRLGYIVPCN